MRTSGGLRGVRGERPAPCQRSAAYAPCGVLCAGSPRFATRSAGANTATHARTGQHTHPVALWRRGTGPGVFAAPVGGCGYNLSVPTELSADLRADLIAAGEDAESCHHDLCERFDEDEPGPCSCGVPGLLRRLVVELEAGWVGPGARTQAA